MSDVKRVFPWWYKWIVAALFAVLVVVVATFAFVRQGQIQDAQRAIQRTQTQTLCIARLQGDFEAAVGEALNAPPAPNPRRDQAVTDIASSADRLKRSAKLCP